MPSNFSQHLAHASGGRRFCFVIMSFHDRYSFFRDIKQIVGEETGFECLRADDVAAPGESVREKVHAAIESAVFVLADITDPRPNIYYEIGYALARGKQVLLLIRKGLQPQTDLGGIELIEYADSAEGWPAFEHDLRNKLRVHNDSKVSLLRAMIIPPDPSPSYLLIHPKKKVKRSRFRQHPRELRTFGDYLGLMGILNVFASTFGERHAPEIVSAPHAAPQITKANANLFLIGSPKVNKFTKRFLNSMQKAGGANWQLSPAPGENPKGDYEVQLTGCLSSGKTFKTVCGRIAKPNAQDYGIILRGPHPEHPGRSVSILAGPHSVGTGAACLAATKTQLVSEIAKCFVGKLDISTRDRTFWVLVKAAPGLDHHIDADRVKIVDVGVYS
jgi:hypothetical protein